MANYPKELLDLVQEYLTDGVITAKERQVLINKAVSLGVDANEFDLYIDAQEQKLQNVAAEAAKQQKGRLCPFCQASLPMFADRCPECGGNITPEASKEVEELIDTLENALVSFKAAAENKKDTFKMNSNEQALKSLQDMKNVFSGKGFAATKDTTNQDYATKKAEVERYIRKAKMYYSNNKTVNFLVAEVEAAIADAEKSIAAAKKKKRNIIIASVAGLILFYVILGLFFGLRTTPEEDLDTMLKDAIALVKEGKTDNAATMLKSHDVPEFVYEDKGTSNTVKVYDAAFLAVVEAYWNAGEFDKAESIALTYKSKIGNDMSWQDSSVYTFLKSKYKKEDLDFSPLRSMYDLDRSIYDLD